LEEVISTIIGILLGIAGAAINNFGIVLQKRQINIKMKENLDKSDLDISKFLKDPLWIFGILGQTIIYLPFLIIALDFIGVTLLQPISNSGIIFLVLGLIFLLGEKIKRLEIFGIILMVFGVIIVSFGNVVGDITLANILSLNSVSNFWIIFSIICILSIISLIFIMKIEETRLAFLGLLIGNCYAMVSISLQYFITSVLELQNSIAIVILILGIIGSVLGTIFAILSSQEAFKRGQAINIIPFTQITMNIIPILAGIFVFSQQILSPFFFWVGVVTIIISATLLARFQKIE
jgi:drug/metabolite transporter (DMT)-like permease